jgi:microcin C transport system substrate-binding protein
MFGLFSKERELKKTLLVFLLGSLAIIGCNQNKSSGNKETVPPPKSSSPAVTAAQTGDLDPITDTNAKAGGTLNTWGSGFPKSFNVWLDNNTLSQEIMGLLFEGLVALHSTKNEPVGVLAESWTISPDGKKFSFKMNPNARWSDGKPVTAGDVQFYYDVIMNPKNMTSIYRVELKRFKRPEVIDDRTLSIEALETHWSNFWSAAGLVAFPRQVWKDVDFNKQNFDFPVVSGPYKIKTVEKNRFCLLERRDDWWGRTRRYMQGKYNIGFIKYKFMEDRNKVLEAFKKGDYDVYPVYTSSLWIKQTDFEAVRKGWAVRQEIFNREPIAYQGFSINMRREKFKDVRVRQALSYCINRELMNEKLMFNQYFMLNSYYPDLYPNNSNPDAPVVRFNPDTARALLRAAGWEVGGDGILAKGRKQLEVSILTQSDDLRHLNIYIEDLKKIGIKAGIEQLSLSSVRKRIDNHDFDLIWQNWSASRLRDPEASWHSSTADQIASNNPSGVKDATIDSLIEKQKTEMNSDKRDAILRLIDKRLCAIVPYVLLWQADHHRMLYWNKFGTPRYVFDKFDREDCIVVYWWVDPAKETALRQAMKAGTSLPIPPPEVRYTE